MRTNFSSTTYQNHIRNTRILRALFLSLFFFAVFYFAYVNWWFISDSFTVHQNPPTVEITTLADKTSMNDVGRRIFYASLPELNDAVTFNRNCSGFSDSVIILGCFTDMRIFILNITDPATANARYFTAAHEMLHAAYDRLSIDEKNRVDLVLEAEYQRLVQNYPDLKDTMAVYAETESGEKYNELHSILGTEYANLAPELEKYYARYFIDRQTVVTLATEYKKVFKDLENERNNLQRQMDSLQTEISSLRPSYESDLVTLNVDIDSFNACAETSGCFHSQQDFNVQRNNLVNRQNVLSDQTAALNAKIDAFNILVDNFNQLGGRAQALQNSINSRAEIQ